MVATLNRDGVAQLTVVFVSRVDDTIVFSTTSERAKTKNLLRDPRISILVLDPGDAGRYVEIRGTARLERDPDKALLDTMYEKYFGIQAPAEPGVDRLIVMVHPTKVTRHP